MQTVVLDVKDSFLQDFLEIVKGLKDKVQLKNDDGFDPYFRQRCEDLERIIKESENGEMELLSQEQYLSEVKTLFQDLKSNENL